MTEGQDPMAVVVSVQSNDVSRTVIAGRSAARAPATESAKTSAEVFMVVRRFGGVDHKIR